MKVRGRYARRHIWPIARRRDTLDGDTVAAWHRPVRQRVAADNGAWLSVVPNRKLKCEELAGFERRQRDTIKRFQMERTLRMNLVLQGSARHTEFAPPRPGA